jgi:hypothetical protein
MKWTPTERTKEEKDGPFPQMDRAAKTKHGVGPPSFAPGKSVLLGGDGRPRERRGTCEVDAEASHRYAPTQHTPHPCFTIYKVLAPSTTVKRNSRTDSLQLRVRVSALSTQDHPSLQLGRYPPRHGK